MNSNDQPSAANAAGTQAPQPETPETPATQGAMDDSSAKSEHTKRCVYCNKRSKMHVVKEADPIESFPWMVRLMLKAFSPGGIELNKRYQCPRCGRNFNDMSVWEALVAPVLLVGFMLVLLLGFFWFVFVIVPAR